MKNFKLSLKKNGTALSKSIASFQNDALRNIASQMVESGQAGGSAEWSKIHGDATWGKA